MHSTLPSILGTKNMSKTKNKKNNIPAFIGMIIVISSYISIIYSAQCCKKFCVPEQQEPNMVYDFGKQFNEKKYWIETNERTGELQICSQRLGIYPEFYKSAKIYCYRAKQVPCPIGTSKNCVCWQSDSVILCQDTTTGDLNVIHTKA